MKQSKLYRRFIPPLTAGTCCKGFLFWRHWLPPSLCYWACAAQSRAPFFWREKNGERNSNSAGIPAELAASSQSELAITSAYESVLQVWLCQTCSPSLKGEFLFTQKKRGAGAGCVSPLAEVWRKSIPPKWIAKHLPIFRYRQIGLTIKKKNVTAKVFSCCNVWATGAGAPKKEPNYLVLPL